MKCRDLILSALLLGLPVALPAQQAEPTADAEAPARRLHGPVEMLIRRAEELELTPEQVGRLEEIGRRMEEQNRPLVGRLVEIRRAMRPQPPTPRAEMTPEQREAFDRGLEEARPLMRRIRENNHAAMEEVRAVLTPDQRVRLREMLLERKQQRGRRPHAPGV